MRHIPIFLMHNDKSIYAAASMVHHIDPNKKIFCIEECLLKLSKLNVWCMEQLGRF